MTEGRQREGDQKAGPTGKVVRLPRDWLGPRDELVPFGHRSAPSEAEFSPPALASETSTLLADSPPTAADFWGERSAAIHDVVQAPMDGGAQRPAPAITSHLAAHRLGLANRRVVAASLVAVAAAAAIVVLSARSSHRVPVGPESNTAAILSRSVSRILRIVELPRIMSANRASRPRIRPGRRLVHPVTLSQPAPEETSHKSSLSLSTSTYAARATSTRPPPSYPSGVSSTRPPANTSRPQSSASNSSGASVSPTGESGALGPVQSPNG